MYIICIYLWVIHPKGRDLMQVFYPYLLSFLIHVEQLMVNFYRTTIHLYIFFVHWQTILCFFFNIYYIFDCARSLLLLRQLLIAMVPLLQSMSSRLTGFGSCGS